MVTLRGIAEHRFSILFNYQSFTLSWYLYQCFFLLSPCTPFPPFPPFQNRWQKSKQWLWQPSPFIQISIKGNKRQWSIFRDELSRLRLILWSKRGIPQIGPHWKSNRTLLSTFCLSKLQSIIRVLPGLVTILLHLIILFFVLQRIFILKVLLPIKSQNKDNPKTCTTFRLLQRGELGKREEK